MNLQKGFHRLKRWAIFLRQSVIPGLTRNLFLQISVYFLRITNDFAGTAVGKVVLSIGVPLVTSTTFETKLSELKEKSAPQKKEEQILTEDTPSEEKSE